jgi:hypothetical protein
MISSSYRMRKSHRIRRKSYKMRRKGSRSRLLDTLYFQLLFFPFGCIYCSFYGRG